MKAGLPNAEDAETSQRTQKEQPKIENDFSHQIIGAADGTPGAMASLKLEKENWLVASCMRAPTKRSDQKGEPP